MLTEYTAISVLLLEILLCSEILVALHVDDAGLVLLHVTLLVPEPFDFLRHARRHDLSFPQSERQTIGTWPAPTSLSMKLVPLPSCCSPRLCWPNALANDRLLGTPFPPIATGAVAISLVSLARASILVEGGICVLVILGTGGAEFVLYFSQKNKSINWL
jgi:hypothetical protein